MKIFRGQKSIQEKRQEIMNLCWTVLDKIQQAVNQHNNSILESEEYKKFVQEIESTNALIKILKDASAKMKLACTEAINYDDYDIRRWTIKILEDGDQASRFYKAARNSIVEAEAKNRFEFKSSPNRYEIADRLEKIGEKVTGKTDLDSIVDQLVKEYTK